MQVDISEITDDSIKKNSPASNPEDDGRNREWQDRARVNLEETPEGTHTNVERDFEPENTDDGNDKTKKEIPPAY